MPSWRARARPVTCYVTLLEIELGTAEAPEFFATDEDTYATGLMFLAERFQHLLPAAEDVGLIVVDSRFREADGRLRRFFADLTQDGTPYSRLDRIVEGLFLGPEPLLDWPPVRRPGRCHHCRSRARRGTGAWLPEDVASSVRSPPGYGLLDGVGIKRFPETVRRPREETRLFDPPAPTGKNWSAQSGTIERCSSRTDRLLLSPSDVTGFLACEHSDDAVGRGRARRARQARGRERAGRARLPQGPRARGGLPRSARAPREGRREISLEPDLDWERARARDRGGDARRRRRRLPGARSSTGAGAGVADFLERQPRSARYEALDTKLARHAKPAYILQLCFYSEQLARIQGREPEQIHVLLGNGERRVVPAARSSPPTRGACARGSSEFVAEPPATRAVPVRPLRHLRVQAALRRVVGRGRQPLPRRRLWRRADRASSSRPGSRRSPALARAAGPSPAGLTADRSRSSAARPRSSSERRETGAPVYELLQPRAGRGFALLPEPSPGDLFFDLEGNPFWDEQGSLEYLWGIIDTEDDFTPLWARRPRERARARSSSSST